MKFFWDNLHYIIIAAIILNIFLVFYLKYILLESNTQSTILDNAVTLNDIKSFLSTIENNSSKNLLNDDSENYYNISTNYTKDESFVEEIGKIMSDSKGGIPLVGPDDGKYKQFLDINALKNYQKYYNSFYNGRKQNIRVVFFSLGIILLTAIILMLLEFKVKTIKKDPFDVIIDKIRDREQINGGESYYLMKEN